MEANANESTSRTNREASWFSERINFILLGIVLLGAALRLGFLLCKGTLWFDEATVALNLRESVWFLLNGQLYYDQRAPVGWLLLHKGVHEVFGASATAVRFPALLANVAALVFLMLVVRRISSPAAAVIVLGVASFSPTLVLYSAELKHYSFDFLAGAVFAWFIMAQHQHGFTRRFIILFNLAAIATAPLSLPGVFCAAAAQVAISLSASDLASRARRFLYLSAWTPVSAFCLYWFATVYPAEIRTEYHDMWGFGYMSNQESLRGLIRWPVDWIIGLQELMIGSTILALIAAGVLVIGLAAWEARFRWILIGLAGVLVLGIAGSALGLYPPVARLALFALPAVLLLTGIGFDWVASHPRRGNLVATGFAALICLATVDFLVAYLRHGYIRSDKLGAAVGRLENISRGYEMLEEIDKGGKLLVLLPKATTPALAFHHPLAGLPSNRLWVEGKQPLDPKVDLQDTETFSIGFYPPNFDNSFVAPGGPGSQFEATPELLAFMEAAHVRGDSVALLVTQGHPLYRRIFMNMESAFGAPRETKFPGGVIIHFDAENQ